LVDRFLDGFEGKLTTAKWAVIAKCSTDTALRYQKLAGAWNIAQAGRRETKYRVCVGARWTAARTRLYAHGNGVVQDLIPKLRGQGVGG
jgi:hypothetical protein